MHEHFVTILADDIAKCKQWQQYRTADSLTLKTIFRILINFTSFWGSQLFNGFNNVLCVVSSFSNPNQNSSSFLPITTLRRAEITKTQKFSLELKALNHMLFRWGGRKGGDTAIKLHSKFEFSLKTFEVMSHRIQWNDCPPADCIHSLLWSAGPAFNLIGF